MDKITTSVLEIFSERHSLSCKDLAAILNCDIFTIGKEVSYLRKQGYIRCTDIEHLDSEYIYPESPFVITVEGRVCLETLKAEHKKSSRDLFFKISNFVIAAVALIISIIALLK